MAEHKNKFYKYDEALKLKHPNEDSIAKIHNARPSKKVTLAQTNDVMIDSNLKFNSIHELCI